MKVVGIIAEYNPFHNGHKHHILEAKRQTGADYVIVVMSGDFVQRGAPSIIDKYSRTKAALESAADLVFELPVIYSTASAQHFSLGAVSLLEQLGLVDYICFGSESGNIDSLTSVANYLNNNSIEYNKDINKLMKEGITFPEARQIAIKKNNPAIDDNIISSPNNILGIEYIKACLDLNSNIIPLAIPRVESTFHEVSLNFNKNTHSISSATAVRRTISDESNINKIKQHVPNTSFNILEDEYNKTFPIYQNDFSQLLKYKLLQESKESLTEYIDVSSDLANRIKNSDFASYNFSTFAKEVKSKQWTLTRINRSLIHILLNLKNENLDLYNENNYVQYARLLGFNKRATKLISDLKSISKIPIITKLSESYNMLSDIELKMLNEDIFASDLYNLIAYEKFGHSIKNEFRQGLEIV